MSSVSSINVPFELVFVHIEVGHDTVEESKPSYFEFSLTVYNTKGTRAHRHRALIRE